jgi:hypothetical protein
MNRGDGWEDTFADDRDPRRFLATMGEACSDRRHRFFGHRFT